METGICGRAFRDHRKGEVSNLAMDWTGLVEPELLTQTCKSWRLATVRCPELEVTARVQPFENERGLSLRAIKGLNRV